MRSKGSSSGTSSNPAATDGCHRDQPRVGLPCLGDDDLFAPMSPFEQLRKVRLGFVYVRRDRHEQRLVHQLDYIKQNARRSPADASTVKPYRPTVPTAGTNACWKATGTMTVKYVDRELTADGTLLI